MSGENSRSFGKITVGKEQFEVTTSNLRVVEYIAQFAIFNHCTIETPEGSKGYIWQQSSEGDETYDRYFNFALLNDAEVTKNTREPTEYVLDNFIAHNREDFVAPKDLSEVSE